MSLSLPKDIYNEIVDSVQALNDVKSLRNLALTSRLFLRRSQYHLFSHHITISNIEKLHSFCIFLDAHPDRRPWVRSVAVFSRTLAGAQSPSFFNAISESLQHFQRLPSLYRCKIGDPYGHSLIFPNSFKLQGPYSRILTHLHLVEIIFPSRADFARYILAFPALRHLECRELHFNHEDDATALTQVRERLSEELHLSHLTIHAFPDGAAVTLLFESTRHTLQELVVDIRDYPYWDDVELPAHIPYMSKLTSITLEVVIYDEVELKQSQDVIQDTVEILHALASAPDLHVTHITIHLLDHNVFQIFDYLHNHSDDLLQMCRTLEPALLSLPRLQKIEFSHELRQPLRNWTPTRLEDYFPTLCEQGLIDTWCSASPIRSHSNSVIALAVSPDSRWIASCSADMTIILWDARRGTIVDEWIALFDNSGSLTFSRDGRYLASVCSDSKVRVWDGCEGASETRLVSTLDDAKICVWLTDGSILVFGANTEIVQIWNPSTNHVQLHSLLEGALTTGDYKIMDFSPDGRWITVQDYGGWGVWNVTTGRPQKVLPGMARHTLLRSTMFDPAGRRIVIVSDRHSARIWDVETGEELVVLGGHGHDMLDHITFSPDGTRVLSTTWPGPLVVTLWDSFSGDILLSFEAHQQMIQEVCFSPDGNHVASVSSDHTVKLWDTRDGACVRTFTEHDTSVWCAVFSPDGETLVSGGDDGTVCIRQLRDVCPEVYSG